MREFCQTTIAAVAQNKNTSASHSAVTIFHDVGGAVSGCDVSISSVIYSEAKFALP